MRKTQKDSVTQPLEGALWLLNWPDVCHGSLINLWRWLDLSQSHFQFTLQEIQGLFQDELPKNIKERHQFHK